jgi:ribosomal protein L16 Arg81 hydroxylase
MLNTFADILRPVAPEDFFAEHHGKEPLYIPGAPDKFASVLDRGSLSELLSTAQSWPAKLVRVVLDTETVDPRQYCRHGRDREGRAGLLVDPVLVSGWMKNGATVRLAAIDDLTPGARAATQAVEQATGGVADANVYISQRGHQGFGPHFDRHDVYAIQIHGTKTWRVYQCHFDHALEHTAFQNLGDAFHEAHKGSLSHEIPMAPGDLLYIPRGWYHDAVAVDPVSVHITLGVNEPVGLDVVRILYERAVQDPLFRKSLPRMHQDHALDRHLAILGERLAEYAQEQTIRGALRDFLCQYNYSRVTGDVLADVIPDDTAPDRARVTTGDS